MKTLNGSFAQRTVALCYVRQSWTRDGADKDSPERQRANIEIVCRQYGWTPEFYEDADGHRSGTKVKNRPGWLALERRLNDTDVAAVVANDLARLHRKGWRISKLLDFMDERGIALVLAAPGKQVDFSSPQGRALAQLSAIFDEWYAYDIAQRAKDSIAFRKRKGITVGRPPFGTSRNDEGFLEPSPDGAWLLPDNTFAAGQSDSPPSHDATWRTYYDTAGYVLREYAQNDKGIDALSYQMQAEGWPFRDKEGNPCPMESDDVRRIVANWQEYGGFVSEKRARDRHPHDLDIGSIRLNPERAVFPVDLLYRVGQVRLERSVRRPANDGIKQEDYLYPLNGITFCAHCERLAQEQGDARLRTRLGGKGKRANGRYRHKHGVLCGSTNKSVKAEIYETDFGRLLKLLTIQPSQLEVMIELSRIAAHRANSDNFDDIEQEKQEAIAKCRRRIEAARHLYEDGDISREEYVRRKEQNEREITHWEARTSETEQVALELTLCFEALDKIANKWDYSDDAERQGLVRGLFTHVVYDLDVQRIVDFRLKPWADRWITLRAALYEDMPLGVENKPPQEVIQGVGKGVTLTGLEPVFSP